MVQCASGTRALVGSDPQLERVELALTLQCGSLFDPQETEGLAHLAEHVTLAADPAELNSFIDERVGSLNAFTAEETTTFHLEFEIEEGAEPLAEVREVVRRFAALFVSDAWRTTPALVRQELPRIHSEWEVLTRAPPRQALELAALRQSVEPSHAWRRVGRGDATSLPLSDVARLTRAVDQLRRSHYSLASATLAMTSPLPLDSAAQLLRSAFGTTPPKLGVRPVRTAAEEEGMPARIRSPPLHEGGGSPLAIEAPRGGRRLTAVWSLGLDDPVGASRSKPLALLGMALTSPHAGGLEDQLRAARLSPPVCAQEPVVLARTVARTSGWVVWQVEMVLADGAENRWRDALRLCRAAVAAIAEDGMPTHVASESATIADIAWRYSSRPPTALELSVDQQTEPVAALSISAGRSFLGTAATNAAAATAAARACAATTPVVILYVPSLAGSVVVSSTTSSTVPLRSTSLDTLFPMPDSTAAPLATIALPPPNTWLPALGPAVVKPLMDRLRLGACDAFRTGGELPSCLQARAEDALGVLQLPACISGSGVELGSKAALAAVGCAIVPRPFAAVLLQLYTKRPQQRYNGDARGSRTAALAELWRYALAEAVGLEGALAARAGAQWEVTFNPAGLRIAVTGHREQVRRLFALVLRLAVQQLEVDAVDAGRTAALRVARGQKPSDLVRAREVALREASSADLAAEVTALWGSMLAADLLVAGPVRKEEAALLVANVRERMRPILPARRGTLEPDLQVEKPILSGLAAWEPLLYRPAYEPRPLAQNLCLEPALAETLDQCGGV